METLQSAKTWLWLNHEFIIAKFRLKLKKVGKTTRPFNQFSHSVVYDSLWSRGLQHTRLPCPSPTHGAYSKSCPSSWWCHPTISSSVIPFSFCLQSFPHQNLFQWVSSLYQVAKVLELQLQHRPSNEYSGLISFRMDWFDLLAVQGTLKGLLQHHSSIASILRCSVFFMVQLSHPYMTTGKTTALTMQIFVGKVMFLLFNILSRFVIAFLPRSKCLLISWLQSPSAVILSPIKENLLLLLLFPLFTMK